MLLMIPACLVVVTCGSTLSGSNTAASNLRGRQLGIWDLPLWGEDAEIASWDELGTQSSTVAQCSTAQRAQRLQNFVDDFSMCTPVPSPSAAVSVNSHAFASPQNPTATSAATPTSAPTPAPTDGFYKRCAKYDGNSKYPNFKLGVVIYRSLTLHTAGLDLTSLPDDLLATHANGTDKYSEADLQLLVGELPTDAKLAVQQYCDAANGAQVTTGCFRRDSTALAVVRDARTGAVVHAAPVQMVSLAAGDEVLVVDERTGEVKVDRVSINLHTRDQTTDARGVTLHYDHRPHTTTTTTGTTGTSSGELSLTNSHLVIANGTPTAAAEVRVGDELTIAIVETAAATAGAAIVATAATTPAPPALPVQVVRVSRVEAWEGGGIINPLTHSGRILASTPSSSPSQQPPGSTPAPLLSFVASTTVLAAPLDAQLTLVAMPSLLKLGSLLFPEQLQASEAVERAVLGVCGATAGMHTAIRRQQQHHHHRHRRRWLEVAGWAASVLLFAAVDLLVGSGFVLFHLVSSLLSSLGTNNGTAVAVMAAAVSASALACGDVVGSFSIVDHRKIR